MLLIVVCVMPQHHDERNYHIFYCILAGLSPSEKQVLELEEATDYYYLTQVNMPLILTFFNSFILMQLCLVLSVSHQCR